MLCEGTRGEIGVGELKGILLCSGPLTLLSAPQAAFDMDSSGALSTGSGQLSSHEQGSEMRDAVLASEPPLL
jgi:hypothetical protein